MYDLIDSVCMIRTCIIRFLGDSSTGLIIPFLQMRAIKFRPHLPLRVAESSPATSQLHWPVQSGGGGQSTARRLI